MLRTGDHLTDYMYLVCLEGGEVSLVARTGDHLTDYMYLVCMEGGQGPLVARTDEGRQLRSHTSVRILTFRMVAHVLTSAI